MPLLYLVSNKVFQHVRVDNIIIQVKLLVLVVCLIAWIAQILQIVISVLHHIFGMPLLYLVSNKVFQHVRVDNIIIQVKLLVLVVCLIA